MSTVRALPWILICALVGLAVVRTIIPETIRGFPVREALDLVWHNGLVPLASFIDRHFASVLSWPVAVVTATFLALRSDLARKAALTAASRIKSLEFLGLGVELSEQMIELKRETEDLSRIIPVVRQNLAAALNEKVVDMKIDQSFCRLVKAVSRDITQIKPDFKAGKCRATIHIESILFPEELMQLLDYVAGNGTVFPGKTAGRAFSIRRGIVGRVWRSQIPEIKGVLPTQASAIALNEIDEIKHIAQIWGLTQNEAEHARNYPSYISIPIRYGNSRTGVFYMDSSLKNAFPEDASERVSALVQNTFADLRLNNALEDLDRSLSSQRQRINVWETIGAK